MSMKRKAPESAQSLREGEWFCAGCTAKNFSARVVCYKCPMTKQESEVRSKGKSALDWDCYKCKAKNFGFRNTCFKCFISKRESDDIKADREGVPWLCRFCNLENFAHRMDCFKCKRAKDMADVIPPRRMMSPPRRMSPPPMMGYPRDRSPPRFGMFPRGRSPPMRGPSPPPMYRGRSRSPPGGGRRLLPSPPRRAISPLNKASVPPQRGTQGEWQCMLCFTSNGPMRNDCYKCTTIRGDGGAGPANSSVHSRIGPVAQSGPGNGKKLKKGQWICIACDVVNFAQRKECFKCKAAKETVAQGSDLSLSITIDNTPKDNPQVVLNHSMKSDSPMSPAKRPRPNPGPGAPCFAGPGNPRTQWGPDWVCGFCRVDVFPKRPDCFKCGRFREECELRSDPRPQFGNVDRNGPGPRDRFSPGPRDRFGPDPRGPDPRGPDPRDRYGPERRDMPGGSGQGYTCRCGNFNRMIEPDCLKCGRPNDHRPRDHPMRGGPSRSPPRFYSNTPRNRPPSPNRKVNKTAQAGKKKEEKKYFPDWKCGKCDFTNFAKRTTCRQCSRKKEEVEEKVAEANKTAIPPNTPKNFEQEWGGKTLPEVIEEYVAMWAECEADPDKKIAEGEIDGRKMIKLKRIAKRLATKSKKKDPEGEEALTAQKNYDSLCSLHQKSFRDVKGSELDWDCVQCLAYNWAQRQKCFKCAADKPVKEGEEAGESAATDDAKPSEETESEENTEDASENVVENVVENFVENGVEESSEKEAMETSEQTEEAPEEKDEKSGEVEEKLDQVEEKSDKVEETVQLDPDPSVDIHEELKTPDNCSDQDVAFQDY